MMCLSQPLRKYGQAFYLPLLFHPCFSRRQGKDFVIVLLGLIEQPGRRTLKGLLRSVWERVSLSGLSRFLGLWPWSPAEGAHTWQATFRQEMVAAVPAEYRPKRAERPRRQGWPKATVMTG